MFDTINHLFGSKLTKKMAQPRMGAVPQAVAQPPAKERERQQTFAKVFRWRVPAEQTSRPTSVEVVGSFSNWQKVPLVYDPATRTWHTTLTNIVGNRTHHYSILVDGKPTYDKTCDGLAIPQGPQEEQWQFQTDNGPRVMLLFGQTK